jgi:hypothetical protein
MATYIVGGLGLFWFQHNVCQINTYHVDGLAEEVLDHTSKSWNEALMNRHRRRWELRLWRLGSLRGRPLR